MKYVGKFRNVLRSAESDQLSRRQAQRVGGRLNQRLVERPRQVWSAAIDLGFG